MTRKDKEQLWEALMALAAPGLEGIEVRIRSDFEGNGVASETWELVWEVRDDKTGFRATSTRAPGREKSIVEAIKQAIERRRLWQRSSHRKGT